MSEFPTPISNDLEQDAESPDQQHEQDQGSTNGSDTAPTDTAAPSDTASGAAAEAAPQPAADGAGPSTGGKTAVLENECEIAADYLEELLDIADLDGDIETYVEGGRAHVSVDTDAKVLVGKDGEVLEALQELSRLAVMTDTGHRSRLMLDIAGHRDTRRTELQDLATDAVQEVKDSGEPVRLQPMNPFERKIVHDYVADAGLVSESEGEEPRRCVVIKAS